MDYILSVHSVNRPFIGSLPRERIDLLKRVQLAIGVNATNFPLNKRSNKYLEPTSKSNGRNRARRLRRKLPIHEIFEPRYVTLEQKCNLSNVNIDLVVKELVKKYPENRDETGEINLIANQWLETRKLTTLQLLQVIQVSMHHEDIHIRC